MDQRTEFAIKALKTDNFRELCREYGISAKTGYKWKERLLRHGVDGLAEESRKPKHTPGALSEEEVCRMVRLKRDHLSWGPRKILVLYDRKYGQAPSESSFKRVLERAGLTEPRKQSRNATQSGRIHQGRQAEEPNDIWTVDFKGWWYDTRGNRCEPLTIRDQYSRYILELYRTPNARTETVKERFERLFERHGLPKAIRSDNGSPFASSQSLWGLSRLSAWWLALGIDLERGRPGCPQDNGGHERMHLDVRNEVERFKKDQEAMDGWRGEFNYVRPHESLGMKTPAEVYQNSACKYDGPIPQLIYPDMETRRISSRGRLMWKNHPLILSTTLQGWEVGLNPTKNSEIEVWFSRLLLGWIQPQTASFHRSDIGPMETRQTNPKV